MEPSHSLLHSTMGGPVSPDLWLNSVWAGTEHFFVIAAGE